MPTFMRALRHNALRLAPSTNRTAAYKKASWVVIKDGRTIRFVGTVRYASNFSNTVRLFVVVWVQCVGTLRLFSNDRDTVRWYAV